MDEMDRRLIKALQRDGRASVSELSGDLGVTRATVKARLDNLRSSGEIAGFSVVTRTDIAAHGVRGLMMLGIEGRGTERVMRALGGMLEVQAVHSTNGTWDLIVEIGTANLESFDAALTAIRTFEGVTRSETSLLLTSRR